jgi:hypothetical protein
MSEQYTNQLITDFYRVAANREFARDFNFRVISINTGGATNAAGDVISFGEDDLVYAKTATLPERAITNVPVPYMGLNFNLPGNATYPGSEGYSLTFYADANSKLRQKFEDWSRYTFDDSNSTGDYLTPKQTSVINLAQLDSKFRTVAQYTLVGVSPRSVGAITYSMAAGTGQTIEFTATMAYHYFTRSS